MRSFWTLRENIRYTSLISWWQFITWIFFEVLRHFFLYLNQIPCAQYSNFGLILLERFPLAENGTLHHYFIHYFSHLISINSCFISIICIAMCTFSLLDLTWWRRNMPKKNDKCYCSYWWSRWWKNSMDSTE